MKIKFVTRYDYFQALLGFTGFVVLLLVNTNLGTVLISLWFLLFGFYKSFGRKITFYESFLITRKLNKEKKINYSEVNKITYTTNLYGKSFIRLLSDNRVYKGYIDYSEWEKLKDYLLIKGIKCDENI